MRACGGAMRGVCVCAPTRRCNGSLGRGSFAVPGPASPAPGRAASHTPPPLPSCMPTPRRRHVCCRGWLSARLTRAPVLRLHRLHLARLLAHHQPRHQPVAHHAAAWGSVRAGWHGAEMGGDDDGRAGHTAHTARAGQPCRSGSRGSCACVLGKAQLLQPMACYAMTDGSRLHPAHLTPGCASRGAGR